MKQDWETGKLSSFVNQFIVPQRDKPKVFDGDIPWCRIEDFDGTYLSKSKSNKCVSQKTIEQMPLRVYPVNTVLVSCSADLGRCAITSKPLVTNQTFIGLVPSDNLHSLFLYYLMKNRASELNSKATGATIKYLSKKKFQELDVSIPAFDEQKRIVGKLDECFEAIDKARANVEKNLNNAKELFQSQLNQIFNLRDEGWVDKKLGNCIKLKSGDGLTAKKMNQNGHYPVYGGNGIAGNHDKYNLEGSQVIIGRVGALCGNTRFINEKIWLTDNAFKVSEFFNDFDKPFLTYLLNYKNLRSYARQSAQPVISNSSTKDIPLQFPENVELQKSIVNQLDELKTQTQSLESNYQQELDALDELKKSILQKAFNGEL